MLIYYLHILHIGQVFALASCKGAALHASEANWTIQQACYKLVYCKNTHNKISFIQNKHFNYTGKSLPSLHT